MFQGPGGNWSHGASGRICVGTVCTSATFEIMRISSSSNLQRPGHWQNCAFQPVKRGDVSRATRIGKIVKMLGRG